MKKRSYRKSRWFGWCPRNQESSNKQEKQTHHSHRRTFKNKYDQSFFPLMTSCISGKSCRNLFDSYSSCLSPLASTCWVVKNSNQKFTQLCSACWFSFVVVVVVVDNFYWYFLIFFHLWFANHQNQITKKRKKIL